MQYNIYIIFCVFKKIIRIPDDYTPTGIPHQKKSLPVMTGRDAW